jgi:hypothetical protein
LSCIRAREFALPPLQLLHFRIDSSSENTKHRIKIKRREGYGHCTVARLLNINIHITTQPNAQPNTFSKDYKTTEISTSCSFDLRLMDGTTLLFLTQRYTYMAASVSRDTLTKQNPTITSTAPPADSDVGLVL